MRVERLFSQAELAAVAEAARQAEERTSGEIVPYVVGASDGYEDACWLGGLIGALAAALGSGLVHWLGGFWGGAGLAWTTLPVAAGAALGYAATRTSEVVRRLLVADEVLDRRVRRRALQAFVEEEVFRTRDRTGILLFVSLFERRVAVLGDAGINRSVEPGAWDEIVAGLVAGIRSGRPGAALIAAIHACGELLQRHGVTLRADDTDELANRLRLRER